jgi:hypothetical protein
MVAEVLHNNYENNSHGNHLIFSTGNFIQQETSCNTPAPAKRCVKGKILIGTRNE